MSFTDWITGAKELFKRHQEGDPEATTVVKALSVLIGNFVIQDHVSMHHKPKERRNHGIPKLSRSHKK